MLIRPKPRNVVLLSIDALRADHLSCNGYHRTTTPNIDRIAADGLQFTNAFSPSSHTREAVPAFLTGRYPDEATDSGYRLDADTVAAQFADRGYATGAFHSNPFLSRAYGYDADFDEFHDDLRVGNHKLVVLAQRALDKLRNRHYARANVINERSLEWIDAPSRTDSGFFLWNHYMDVHGPYEPPKRYQEPFRRETVDRRTARKLYKRAMDAPESLTERDHQTLVDLYDAEISYVDDFIGRFFSALSERGLLDESLVIVTADHGDAFGEHGYYEHPRRLDTELLRVPLVVSHPSLEHNRHDGPVSTLDIVPTVLDAVRMKRGEYPGRPLSETLDDPGGGMDRLVFSQVSGEGEEAAVKRFAARNATVSHTIETDVDSGEIRREHGATEADKRILESLRAHSRERLSARNPHRSPIHGAADSEIEERLHALGYRE